MRKDIKQLAELVKKEALQLRIHAYPLELERLNLKHFDASLTTSCIYGQMTGDCYSRRAQELIQLCCEKVCKVGKPTHNGVGVNDQINGAPEPVESPFKRSYAYHSPTEVFVLNLKYEFDNKNLQILIDYLKGESDELIFDESKFVEDED